MKKITTLVLMVAINLIGFSCKKDESVNGNGASLHKEVAYTLEKSIGKTNSYEVGGTIGCFIRFRTPSDANYNDNDAYESCLAAQTHAPTFGESGPGHTLYPIFIPPPIYCVNCDDIYTPLMDYYFELLGVSTPQTTLELSTVRARSRLDAYNLVITAVFTDPLANLLNIPEDRTIRRNMLLAYTGTLPTGIVDYVDFVYGKYFAVEWKYTGYLFDLIVEPNNDTFLHTFGVKTIALHGEFLWENY